jgi:hypothetical protein
MSGFDGARSSDGRVDPATHRCQNTHDSILSARADEPRN